MINRIEKAQEYHAQNYNCCQSVACAFCDCVGIDEATMFRIAEGFGLGMGNMDGVCGALSAAILLAGLKNSTADLERPTSKGSTYKLAAAMLKEFKEKNGSIICRDLKGMDTGKVLRSCPGCIEDGAKIAAKILELNIEG